MAIALSQEKVTFNLSSEMKQKLLALKEETHLSLSAMYQEAVEEYVRNKERERWRKAALKAREAYEEEPGLAEFSILADQPGPTIGSESSAQRGASFSATAASVAIRSFAPDGVHSEF